MGQAWAVAGGKAGMSKCACDLVGIHFYKMQGGCGGSSGGGGDLLSSFDLDMMLQAADHPFMVGMYDRRGLQARGGDKRGESGMRGAVAGGKASGERGRRQAGRPTGRPHVSHFHHNPNCRTLGRTTTTMC